MNQLVAILYMAYNQFKNRKAQKASEELFEKSKDFEKVRPYQKKYNNGEIPYWEYSKVYDSEFDKWLKKFLKDNKG